MNRVRDELAVAVRLLLPNGLVPNGGPAPVPGEA